MSTTETLTSDDDVAGMVEDLKKWPSTAVDNGEYELAVMPFITFYFTYTPAHYLATSLAMIEVHEAFERLAGKPYKIATHPDSERPHPYGSKRLGDLREWARKTRIDKSFLFNFTDEKNHRSSPTMAGYFWRSPDWDDGSSRRKRAAECLARRRLSNHRRDYRPRVIPNRHPHPKFV